MLVYYRWIDISITILISTRYLYFRGIAIILLSEVYLKLLYFHLKLHLLRVHGAHLSFIDFISQFIPSR